MIRETPFCVRKDQGESWCGTDIRYKWHIKTVSAAQTRKEMDDPFDPCPECVDEIKKAGKWEPTVD